MINLFQDQEQSLEDIAHVMKRGIKYVLYQGATGSGKSMIAAAVIARALKKNKKVWFTVPRKILLHQMSETFSSFDMQHSFIAAGYPMNPHCRAHICSADSLRSRLGGVSPPDLAIIDECHHGGAGLDIIIKWLKQNGAYIIFLSATPWRLSGEGLKKWADEMVCGPSIRWLIDNKRLSDYRMFAPHTPDLSGVKITAGDYAKGALSDRMEQDRILIGNAVEHYKKHALGKLGVTFAVSRKHSELLAQSYRDHGISAVHVDGETPMHERTRIFRAYARREIMQLCNAALLGMGFDIASAAGVKGVTVESINDCDPSLSLAKQMQKWGRGLRYDDAPHLFFDHAGNVATHDLPCAEREWTLEDRIKKSRAQSDEKTIPVRSCPSCFYAFRPAPTCPACGAIMPVQYREVAEQEGELSEIDKLAARKAKKQEVGMAKTMDELKQIAVNRGYKRGWVNKMAQLKRITS